jgi:MFS family permease
MQKGLPVEAGKPAGYAALQLPIMLGSLPLTMLTFLLPIYAKQLGASATGIGGLFAVAQLIMVLCRPVIGWGIDRFGRRGFCIAGLAGYTGAMGVFALAGNLTTLYLAQLLHGIATACMWTAAYTITTELAPPADQAKALGRVDEYANRGALYGMGLALAFLSWWTLDTALRVLFLSYMALTAVGMGAAWKQVPETRPPPQPAGRQVRAFWPFVNVILLVFLSYLCTALLRPVFLVFLQDELTQDVRLLALAFLPAILLESFLPSRLGRLSDRWGRRPLIIAGLTWAGLSCIGITLSSALAWSIVWWTLRTFGLAAALPPQKALISDLTEDATRGTGYGLHTFATSLGSAVGPLVGGWAYDNIGHSIPFFITGIIFLASLGWVSLLLRWPGHAPPGPSPKTVPAP